MHKAIYYKVPEGPDAPAMPYRLTENPSVSYLALKDLMPSNFSYADLQAGDRAPERTFMMKRWTGEGMKMYFRTYAEMRWFDCQKYPYWRNFHRATFMFYEWFSSELGRKQSPDYPEMTYLLDLLPGLDNCEHPNERSSEAHFVLGAAIDRKSFEQLAITCSRELLRPEKYEGTQFVEWCNFAIEMYRYVTENGVLLPVYELSNGGMNEVREFVMANAPISSASKEDKNGSAVVFDVG